MNRRKLLVLFALIGLSGLALTMADSEKSIGDERARLFAQLEISSLSPDQEAADATIPVEHKSEEQELRGYSNSSELQSTKSLFHERDLFQVIKHIDLIVAKSEPQQKLYKGVPVGLTLTVIEEGDSLGSLGFRPGDTIVSFNRRPVTSFDDLMSVLQKQLLLRNEIEVIRRRELKTIMIEATL
ncbi:MAG: hypothetical protein J5J00_11950 [Deltaproteobacteria bacterium]|nr:hypothetical protein [Deltaproteobacteria bacterium]